MSWTFGADADGDLDVDYSPDGEWERGQCDHCGMAPGEVGPFGICCACAIGEGAPQYRCACAWGTA